MGFGCTLHKSASMDLRSLSVQTWFDTGLPDLSLGAWQFSVQGFRAKSVGFRLCKSASRKPFKKASLIKP